MAARAFTTASWDLLRANPEAYAANLELISCVT